MGAFKTRIMQTADWWGRTPQAIQDEFFSYLASSHEQEFGAFSTTRDKNDAAFAQYLFGEGTRKKPGFIAQTTREVGLVVDRIEQNAPPAHQDRQRMVKMTEYLDFLDRYADMIVSRGNLVLKREMIASVFAGLWTPPVGNAVPPPSAGQANLYDGKHFGTNTGVGSYIPFTDSRFQVKSMEDKAVEYGLEAGGGAIFRFDRQIGYDGVSKAFGLNTKAIRVDSIGSLQHSHPFPETNFGIASFEKYVIEELVLAAIDKNLDRIVEIGKFLTVIGARPNEFTPKKQHIAKVAGPRGKSSADVALPDCVFW
jgi:hypothetical protein